MTQANAVNGKTYGAYVSGVSKRINKLGLSKEIREKIAQALQVKPKEFRLSRPMIARANKMIHKNGVAVVTFGKVYSLEGYQKKLQATFKPKEAK